MRSDARVEDTEFRIGDNNTVEIEALGDRPVSQRLSGMLQAGLEPDEMAELLVLFEGKYDINTDGKGAWLFLQGIARSHLQTCANASTSFCNWAAPTWPRMV
jgi:hypothetical protein